DYIEHIIEQSADRDIFHGFTLRMPANWANPRAWIPDLLNANDDEILLFKQGALQESVALSLLFSSWVLEMIENLLVRDPVAACFLLRNAVIETFLWDGPRDLMTSLISEGLQLETFATQVLVPLWAKSEEIVVPGSKTKEVIVQEEFLPIKDDDQKKISSKDRKLLQKVEWILRDVDVNDTMRRIERAEAILGELERLSTKKEEEPQGKANHIETKVKETVDRLEALHERLSLLEKRIAKICEEIG
ncbi:MAG: hypothetical protein ACFFDR_13360, partial [Candidatus Thorarchaeota archaeon]